MSGAAPRAAPAAARRGAFPRTVDEIFDDFVRRRHALQRALTEGARSRGAAGRGWAPGAAGG
jgi:hypothetical protein